MLQREPSRRPLATEVLAHPYFTTSLLEDAVTSKTLVASNTKMEVFRQYVHTLREQFMFSCGIYITPGRCGLRPIAAEYEGFELFAKLGFL